MKNESKPLVFIAHPVSGDIERNLKNASVWVRWAALHGLVYPVAPYISLCQALNDRNQFERRIGMNAGHKILARCDELWLCGLGVTRGMRADISIANLYGVLVVDLTGQELP